MTKEQDHRKQKNANAHFEMKVVFVIFIVVAVGILGVLINNAINNII